MSAPEDETGALVPSLVLDTDVSDAVVAQGIVSDAVVNDGNGDIVKTSSADEAGESSDESDDAFRLEESGTVLYPYDQSVLVGTTCRIEMTPL
jgi:hypothetical protein